MLQLGPSRSSSNRVSPDNRNGGWLSRNMLLQRAAACRGFHTHTTLSDSQSRVHMPRHPEQPTPLLCITKACCLETLHNRTRHTHSKIISLTHSHTSLLCCPCMLPLDGQETANTRHWIFSLYCICYFVSLYQLCV